MGTYFPARTGGTEVYVRALAEALEKRGADDLRNTVLTSGDIEEAQFDRIDGIEVVRYPVRAANDLRVVRAQRAPEGMNAFEEVLRRCKPDIYHQHSWVTGCGLHHLKTAKRVAGHCVVTVHVPGNVCVRGTMLEMGKQPCDGRVRIARCSACWAHSRGIPSPLREAVSHLPVTASRAIADRQWKSRFLSVLSTTSLLEQHLDRLHELARLADRVVAVSGWLFDALRANGVPERKLVLCRQGVTSLPDSGSGESSNRPNDGLTIGFVGRWDRVKGVDVIVAAVRSLPANLPVRLLVYASEDAGSDATYRALVEDIAASDERIRFKGSVAPEDVFNVIRNLDVLAVPSQWLETGPLVVLEAQAVGVPVLGSDRGGISELVEEGVDGLLVKADDVASWASAISRLAQDKALLQRLRDSRRRPVRTMHDVAAEMFTLYAGLDDAGPSAQALRSGD